VKLTILFFLCRDKDYKEIFLHFPYAIMTWWFIKHTQNFNPNITFVGVSGRWYEFKISMYIEGVWKLNTKKKIWN